MLCIFGAEKTYLYYGKGAGFFRVRFFSENVLCRSNSGLYFYGARLELPRIFSLRIICSAVERKYNMKKVRKMLSLFLAGVIAVMSLVCGGVTAGAESNPNYWINGVDGFHKQDWYAVFLDGITQSEMKSIAINLKVDNINGAAHIQFKNHALILFFDVNDANEIVYVANAFYEDDQSHIDIADAALYLTDDEGLSRIDTLDDIPDNGKYCVGFLLDSNDKDQNKMINELQKYNKADSAGFGLYFKDWGLYAGVYDGSGDFWTNNVKALMDTTSDTDSKEVASISFTKSISSLSFSSISSKAYTGKAIKPSVTVKDGTKTLVKGTDYTISYKNNKNIGTATVTITGKGSYTGTKSLTFKIIPAKATLAAKKSNGKYALSWKKVTGIDKYQIQYSTDSGKTYKTAGTVSSGKTSATLKLDTSKSYTFRIRSYKTVDGKKYYSSWSKTVTVK